MWSIIGLIMLALLVTLWQSAMRARKIAIDVSQQLCKQNHYQLLDDTVSLVRIKIQRNSSGHLCLQRTYHFEYAYGDERRNSQVVIQNNSVVATNLSLQNNVIEFPKDGKHL